MLSVVSVNYNSSTVLKECLSSIAAAAEDIQYECIVVDSGSSKDDVEALLGLEGEKVKVILSSGNIGYAKAVNTGIRNTSGDFLLITNPDILYKQDSLKNMLRTLEEYPECGAVGPKTWWDRQMNFMFPCSELVTPYRIFKQELAKSYPVFRGFILRKWIKKAIQYWVAEEPIRQEMLSGGCIMTCRKVLNVTGGFEEAFPLYFEDADWCLRVRKAGFSLYMVPDADVIHYYGHSANKDMEASKKKFDYSMNEYLKRHFQGRSSLFGYLQKILRNCRIEDAGGFYDMGMLSNSPLFQFKGVSKKLILLSPFDTFIPSVGSFWKGDSFSVPADMWDSMGEGEYFARAFNANGFGELMSWKWVKNRSD